MRSPGFGGASAPNSDNSVQWLARRIVADKRFAEATVKFWWPAIMGSEVAESPEDEEDADFEGLLLAANAQGAEVERLARGFRGGYSGGRRHNLKDLLVEIVLSKWFRADAVEDANPVRRVALRDAGARRLLAPEELADKTAAITGYQWQRYTPVFCSHGCERRLSALTGEYRLLYGGIDSDGITERTRDITSVMVSVAKRHAAMVSCPTVIRELYLLPETQRRLFGGIDKHVTNTKAIRRKLVELHDKLLGVHVTPHSPDVEAAYRLFEDARARRREARSDWFTIWNCESWWEDKYFFEGISDDILLLYEDDGWRGYEFDQDRVDTFMDRVDWSDPRYSAQAWVVVLAYLLTDSRYLYL